MYNVAGGAAGGAGGGGAAALFLTATSSQQVSECRFSHSSHLHHYPHQNATVLSGRGSM